MENKLQQLTEKLYNEGLQKGIKEAENLVQKAHHKAQKIIEDAQKTAQEILEKAEKDAAESIRNANSEILLASRQTIASVKQTVENLITTKTIETPVKNSFNDKEFVKELIKSVVEQLQNKENMQIVFPKNSEEEFLKMIQTYLQNEFNEPIEVSFDRNIKSGFRISRKNEGYQLTFTDKDFSELFKTHIRSKLVDLLFDKH